jgi:hypothetical protein
MNDEIEQQRLSDDGAPVVERLSAADAQTVVDAAAAGFGASRDATGGAAQDDGATAGQPAVEPEVTYPPVDTRTRQHLADAIVADVLRTLKAAKPDAKIMKLANQIAVDAVKLTLSLRGVDQPTAAQQRKLAQLGGQLQSLKVGGRILSEAAFTRIIWSVLDRLANFAISKVVGL